MMGYRAFLQQILDTSYKVPNIARNFDEATIKLNLPMFSSFSRNKRQST